MTSSRAVYALALADFLERVRRYSFLVTLLFAVCLGYAAATGQISLRLGEYRGLYTSAWVGAMMSLITTTFLSLVGFYIVKNAVDRDRQTGVGEILASTPLSRISYLLGKFFSNFAVLASMVGVLTLAAVAMQFLVAEDRVFHVWALLSPFLLLSLPAIALTAALAVLFETVRWLRGGFGNIVWVFLWALSIGLPGAIGIPQCDPFGLWTVFRSVVPAAQATIPGYKEAFSLTVADTSVRVFPGFHWAGIDWTTGEVLLRVAWVVAALAIVLLGATFFDRFEPARSRPRPHSKREAGEVALEAEASWPRSSVEAPAAVPIYPTPLPHDVHGFGFTRILVAELRLALQGMRWWWHAVAAGLLIAQLASPLEISRGPLLGVAWLWPALIWCAMGSRELRFATSQLLFSCARILPRQLTACYLAGVTVALFTGAGAGVRLVLARDFSGVFAFLVAAFFIPALALALGVVSRSGKFFEALYTMLWYIGPMNRIPGLDFTGAAGGPLTLRFALIYLILAAALLAAAFLARARQLRSG
jgi:hypothetical protein